LIRGWWSYSPAPHYLLLEHRSGVVVVVVVVVVVIHEAIEGEGCTPQVVLVFP